jgi:hypothetical protein
MARKIPWMRAWLLAQWLYKHGRSRLDRNLTERERAEMMKLGRKSKGRAANLSSRERDRFKALVRQAATGRKA